MVDTPVFGSAAVAAPHHLASEAGRAILAEGGNAIEAMIAMAATIAVVYPHMNGIGGGGFWLIREPSGRGRALVAAGGADRPGRRRRMDARARSCAGAGRPHARCGPARACNSARRRRVPGIK